MKIIGEIPARQGSKRVPRKNLRLLNGKPLITYAIAAAKQAKTLSDIYVNSDSDEIGRLALEHGVKYYNRSAELGDDTTTQDEFNYDFIRQVNPDVLVVVNPVSPLIDGGDIDAMVSYFFKNGLDTLIACRDEYAHAFYEGAPINFDINCRLSRTQDLRAVRLCAWSIGIWKARVFVKQYEEHGHAAFSGKVGLYRLDKFKSLKISEEQDFILAEILLKNSNQWRSLPAIYRNRNEPTS